MGIITKILIIVLAVIVIWAFLPTGVLGEASYDVEVSATINQQKLIGILPFVDEWTISNVNHEVLGESRNFAFSDIFNVIAEKTTVVFCIDQKCQTNSETFWVSEFFGEQRVTSETISKVPGGSHTLSVTLYIDDIVKATHTEAVQI